MDDDLQRSGRPGEHVPPPPAGWYPLEGEMRYWDGLQWTEHRQAQPSYASPYLGVTTDARTNGAEIAFAWVFTICTLGYFLPWAVAATRGKSNSLAIGLLNFLLGWTVLGWLAALVMACLAHQVTAVATYPRY
jgi:hypothetical protein